MEQLEAIIIIVKHISTWKLQPLHFPSSNALIKCTFNYHWALQPKVFK